MKQGLRSIRPCAAQFKHCLSISPSRPTSVLTNSSIAFPSQSKDPAGRYLRHPRRKNSGTIVGKACQKRRDEVAAKVAGIARCGDLPLGRNFRIVAYKCLNIKLRIWLIKQMKFQYFKKLMIPIIIISLDIFKSLSVANNEFL